MQSRGSQSTNIKNHRRLSSKCVSFAPSHSKTAHMSTTGWLSSTRLRYTARISESSIRVRARRWKCAPIVLKEPERAKRAIEMPSLERMQAARKRQREQEEQIERGQKRRSRRQKANCRKHTLLPEVLGSTRSRVCKREGKTLTEYQGRSLLRRYCYCFHSHQTPAIPEVNLSNHPT